MQFYEVEGICIQSETVCAVKKSLYSFCLPIPLSLSLSFYRALEVKQSEKELLCEAKKAVRR